MIARGRRVGIAVSGERERSSDREDARRFGVFFFKVRSGEADLGRTRVVRTESTTAMQALMLEMSWPLPWLVSVPSRRSTIWGCCWREEGWRRKGSDGGQP